MRVYFDCEFTEMHGQLISVGCVAEDGQEFYAELNNWPEANCNTFVIDSVLPLLQNRESRMSEPDFAVRLKTWIEQLTSKRVTFVSDMPGMDWPYVERLFRKYGWPENLNKKPETIEFADEDEVRQEKFEVALMEYWQKHPAAQHHALVDARGLAFAMQKASLSNFLPMPPNKPPWR